MPKCGHTLERDVTANLLSTILSLWFFHFKLRARFNFGGGDGCFSHPCSGSRWLSGCVPSGRRCCILQQICRPEKKPLGATDPQSGLYPLPKSLVLQLIKAGPQTETHVHGSCPTSPGSFNFSASKVLLCCAQATIQP